MTNSEPGAKLNTLLSTLRKQFPGACTGCNSHSSEAFIDSAEPILAEFVRSFLVWESSTSRAQQAVQRLAGGVVDFNELRIAMAAELVRMLGPEYPRVEERALRLRSALNEIYARNHAVTLEGISALSKREARDYLESISGTPGYVVARVLLLTQAGHAAPVDSRIHSRLIAAGVMDPESTPESAAGVLEKRIRAGEMIETYALLQAWSDELPVRPGKSKPKPPGKGASPGVKASSKVEASRPEAAKAKPGRKSCGPAGPTPAPGAKPSRSRAARSGSARPASKD